MKKLLQYSIPRCRNLCLMMAIVLAAFYQSAIAQIRYVKPVATGSGNGSSWANASDDLQAMINASGVQQVWVAAGTYKPNRDAAGNLNPTNPREKTFSLKNGISIYGGFTGTETILTQRNSTTNVTVLSGDIGLLNDATDNTYTVVTGSGTNLTAIIDGFTISGGNANSGNLTDATGLGGGMYNFAGSPTVINCKFSDNKANSGGGMCNYSSSAPNITDCIFINNAATDGGGGILNNLNSAPTITNCTFSNNTSDFGGGMRNDNSSSSTITNCIFSGNLATSAGGGMHNGVSSPTIENCTFTNNTSNGNGGGMLNELASSIVINCSFSSNIAQGWGGGMCNGGTSTPTIKDCTFSNNSANVNAGGMLIQSSSPTLTNCKFLGNSAGVNGGGVLTYGGSPTFTNCAFLKNTANESGGGMFNDSTSPTLTNCTIAGNTANTNGGGMFNGACSFSIRNSIIWGNSVGGRTYTTTASVFNNNATPTLIYSLIANCGSSGSFWNTQIGIDGGNNIASNPLFTSITTEDYSLQKCSPAVNKGDNSVVTEAEDIAGNNRIRQGLVDLGAYESDFVFNVIATPSVTLTAIPSSAIIAGTSVTFTATSTNGGTAPVYVWKKNNVVIPNETGTTFTSSSLINGDRITFEMTSNAVCAPYPTANSSVVIGVYTVSPLPLFTGLNATYCDLDNASTLTGNLPATDAFFTGTGIINNNDGTASFTPNTANLGLNTIRYLSTAAQSPAWKQIEGGFYHSIGLKEDGTLWAWGSNEYGQLGIGNNTDSDIPVQIGTANDWDFISAGIYHNFALKKDGTLWTWGRNGFGVMGIGRDSDVPVQVGTDNDWATISTNNGVYFCVAIKKNGTLWAWGSNFRGKLGIAGGERYVPTQVGAETDWAKVSVGQNHVLAIKTDATLWAWGSNVNGQLGDGTTNQINTPVQIGTANDWKTVRGGFEQSYAIKADGTLWAWGRNISGELGIGTNTNSNVPVQVGNENNWVSIWSGAGTQALKSDGTLWVWGNNEYGQLGNGTNTNRNTPEQIGSYTDWSVLGGGPYHSFAMRANGSLLAAGDNSKGLLGIGINGDKNIFTKVVQARTLATTTINACPDFTGLATAYCKDGQPVTLTGNYAPLGTFSGPGITDNGDGTATFKPAEAGIGGTITYTYRPNAWVMASAGEANTMGIKSDESLWGWGENYNGELGNNTYDETISPLQSGTDKNWKSVSQGYHHSLGIKKDGTLWGWGYNGYGELGTADSYNENPVQIGAATDWKYVVAGYYTSIGIKTDGTLWTWGRNRYGELGNGTTTDSDIPTQVGTSNNWANVSADSYGNHVLATKTDGTLWAWGRNAFGQLGDGTTTNTSLPKQISTSTDWAAIAAGSYHSLAIKTDGTLWSWGSNSYGELGNGTTNNSSTPVKMGTDNNWKTIAASYYFSLAIKTDSTLWGWGYNEYGQLGNGTNTDALSPSRVGTAANWSKIDGGGYHSVGLTVDGNLFGWGYNGNSELGNGTTEDSNVPIVVGSLVPTTTATKNVIVNFTSPPLVDTPIQKIVCFPSTLSLTATGCAGTVTWSNNATGNSLTLSTAGTYSISATCTENGCTSVASDSVALIIDFAENPVLKSENMTICKGESTVLTGTCSSLTDTFRWSAKEFNTPNPLYPNTNRRLISEPGVYKGYCETKYGCLSAEVSLEITQGNDCEDLSFLRISPEKSAICPGQSITLTTIGCTGSVTWFGAGSTYSGTSITYTPTKTGNITAFCSTGSSASAEVVVAQANVIVNKNTSTDRAIVKATETIESDKKVGLVNFTPGANVIFEAGKSITLKPGFVAEKHSVFKAEIKTCN